ncbi:hypothetical protein [Streptomyces sp. NPDC048663]|uniref:hypothetical protein n=1 Tax=Streptomyces sp. NPDC048663 TaxID=3155638 RepID=UPI0034328836
MTEQKQRPSLNEAVAGVLAAQQQAANAAAAPVRKAQDVQAAADVKLMNTPAWDTIGDRRRHRATQYLAGQADTGTTDDANTIAVGLAQGQAAATGGTNAA